jgi:hypothetical protein
LNASRKQNLIVIIVTAMAYAALIAYWAGKPLPRVYETGYSVPLNAFYSLYLVSLVLLAGGGLGIFLLRYFRIGGWTPAEKVLFSLPIGLASLAYLVFGLGLIGILNPLAFSLLLGLIAVWRWRECSGILLSIPETLRSLFEFWKGLRIELKVLCVIGVTVLLLTQLLTLTPPFDYDSLAYHLQGPRLFLEAGRIQPIYENWFTFYPFTWEMLYMLGLGLGSDIFAKLIHFSTLLLFLLSAYVFGRRLVSPQVGWLSTAILLGIPILPLWGSTAYTDIAWALFQFLAVGMILLWKKERGMGYLVLAGVMQGLAMGSKYPALASGAAIGLMVLWMAWRDRGSQSAWSRVWRAGLCFGGTAILVASPWYVKNFVQTGDPVFPLLFKPSGVDPLRVKLWLEYVYSFGVGREWYHYLLLPIHLYTEYKRFGTFIGAVDIPSPVFLLVFAYPLLRVRYKDYRLDWLASFTLVIFVIWAAGSQQTRFLLPIYPCLAIFSGYLLLQLLNHRPLSLLRRLVVSFFPYLLILFTLLVSGRAAYQLHSEMILLGQETKNQFLARMLDDFEGLQFIVEDLPEESKVKMLWDGRGYYCDKRCIPDVDQVYIQAMIEGKQTYEEHSTILDEPYEYILLNRNDQVFFSFRGRWKNVNNQLKTWLSKGILEESLRVMYNDGDVSIYKLVSEKPPLNSVK